MNLIIKLILGIVIGIGLGLFAPTWVVALLLTFKGLFGELLFFTIPLLILFFIASGIAGLPQQSTRLLGQTLAGAYASTIVAGLVAFGAAVVLVPMLSAFVFGLGVAATQAQTLKSFFDQGRDVIEQLLVKVIIPLLPIYIAGVFAELAAAGTVVETLQTFGVILALSVSLHWLWIGVLYSAVAIRTQRSPLALIKQMLPAYFTALGTMSSAATIPVTLKAVEANGVDPKIAGFTVPLCATTHLAGSTITIVACAVAVMVLQEGLVLPSLGAMLPFILTLGVVMLAAPGVPGGAVMSAVGLLGSMLGFGETAVALMIALYMAQDSFGTACNVTGDGAIALWVNASQKS
jgi:Na+/H+-dicarboxylate symporter